MPGALEMRSTPFCLLHGVHDGNSDTNRSIMRFRRSSDSAFAVCIYVSISIILLKSGAGVTSNANNGASNTIFVTSNFSSFVMHTEISCVIIFGSGAADCHNRNSVFFFFFGDACFHLSSSFDRPSRRYLEFNTVAPDKPVPHGDW